MKHIKPFWDDEYKNLKYKKMPFNNKYDVIKWREKGYTQDENTSQVRYLQIWITKLE